VKFALLLAFYFLSSLGLAASGADDFSTARVFYTMTEGPRYRVRKDFSPFSTENPQSLWLLAQLRQSIVQFHLLDWKEHNIAPVLPAEPYNRLRHFGTWITAAGHGCLDTRAQVLIRDSMVAVSFKSNNKCVVESGKWLDPYTGRIFTSAHDLQIDHVVPLKHAYLAGAWAWSPRKRCLYANFMSDDYHLRAVDAHENMSKGDLSPAGYLPPDSKDICGYLTDWLKIKMTWNLILIPKEAEAIAQAVEQNHCHLPEMTMTPGELQTLRAKIMTRSGRCLGAAATKSFSSEAAD
jgi:hypothetical protein